MSTYFLSVAFFTAENRQRKILFSDLLCDLSKQKLLLFSSRVYVCFQSPLTVQLTNCVFGHIPTVYLIYNFSTPYGLEDLK